MRKIFVIISTIMMVLLMFYNLKIYAQDNNCNKELSLLSGLGILSGKIDLDAQVTRAQAAEIVAKLNGYKDIDIDENRFIDVGQDNPNAKYINYVNTLKMMEGYDDGTFRPDITMSYAQAATVFVKMTGYSVYAQAKGGYPTGYLVEAANQKILRNIIINNAEDDISTADFVKMAYNTLFVDVLVPTSFSDKIEYQSKTDENLLMKTFHAYHYNGCIQANYITSLAQQSRMLIDEVMIDHNIYKIGATDAKEHLGEYVDGYYIEDEDSKDRILIVLERDCDVLDINAKKIDDVVVNPDATITISYENNNEKSETEDLEAGFSCIINGRVCTGYSISDLHPSLGSIQLIDSNKNGKYDVVKILSYITRIIDNVNSKNGVITFKDDSRFATNYISIDNPDHMSPDIIIRKDGSNVTLSDLKEWDVIEIAESRYTSVNDRLLTLDVLSKTVTGVVYSLSQDEIEVDGKIYPVADDFISNVYIGNSYTFLFNIMGEICAANTEDINEKSYGYLFDIALTEGIEKRCQIKLLTTDGKWKIFDCTKKVTRKGEESVESSTLIDDPAIYDSVNKKTIRQVIAYKLSNDGKISKIILSSDNDPYFVYSSPVSGVYHGGSRCIDFKIGFSDDTVLFLTPADPNSADERDINVSKYSSFFKNDNTYNNLKVYDVDDTNTAKVCLYTGAITTNSNSPLMVVDHLSKVVDTDGGAYWKITGDINGSKSSLLTDDISILKILGLIAKDDGKYETKIEKGDIIQFEKNRDGLISSLNVLFRMQYYRDKTKGQTPSPTLHATLEIAYGIFEKIDIKTMRARFDDNYTNKRAIDLSTTTVSIYDTQTGRSTAGTLNDIQEGDYAVLFIASSWLNNLIIYK